MNDPTKILLGGTGSSAKTVDPHKGEVAAGLVCKKLADGTVALTGTGTVIGVSLGKDLSDAGWSSVARDGLYIPIQLTAGLTPVIGAVVSVDAATGKAAGTGVATKATYASAAMVGVQEDGTEVPAAYIDFPGGL